MPQIRKQLKTAPPENEFEKVLERELQSFMFELSNNLNNGLKFADNFNGYITDIVDTGIADSANTLTHGLKRVPDGFLVIDTNKAVAAYRASSSETQIVLKFNVANCAVKVFVF